MEQKGNSIEPSLTKDIDNCLEVIKDQGIILYPTDTIWGIGCDATLSNAVAKIYKLKQREEKKALIILVSEPQMIFQYVKEPSPLLIEYLSKATKPTTAIFKNAYNLPENLINADGSIAIRISSDPFCTSLINELSKPLVSTSANISGAPYPQNFPEINEEIKNGVDYIVQHRQNDFTPASPSNIIRLNEKEEIEFLR